MYHIIVNPTAGKKRAAKNLRVVEGILQERKIEYAVHETHAERDGEKIARQLTEAGKQELIVVGGDGTMHEVLGGIVDPTACRLGVIPSGTGNDFAGKIGLPLKPDKALEIILRGECKLTDYLEVGGVRCMNVAGIGMDVDVLERCKKGKSKGKIKYLKSLLKSLFAFKGLPVIVENDGKEERRDVLLAAACNGDRFGGGIHICPPAVVDDGKIDVVVVDCIGGKMKIIKAFLKLMKGKILEYPAASYFRCERVKFLPQTACACQLDGELFTNLNFDVKICKGLQMYR